MEPAATNKRIVLIVEDEPDNREIMRTIAEELLGFRAVLAPDGEAAVQMATALKPSVILMDLMMPVLDGFEAINRLKSNPATATIPIIAVTALSRPADRQRAFDQGANDYLSKPFDIDVLVNTLARYTDSAEVASDNSN